MNYYIVTAGRGTTAHYMLSKNSNLPSPLSPREHHSRDALVRWVRLQEHAVWQEGEWHERSVLGQVLWM